jgi:hypothetical protein
MREYPPAHVIHEALCEDAPAGLLTFRAHLIPAVHPNARAHSCVSPATVHYDREVVAEPGEGRDHLYEPSGIKPDDATRALCRHCSGTHGEVDLASWLRSQP